MRKAILNSEVAEVTDFSFESLGIIDRTEENIANAASKLNLDSDKMNAALFLLRQPYYRQTCF